MNVLLRMGALAATIGVAGCTGGAATAAGFGPRCDPNLPDNKVISIAGQFTLYVNGAPLSDSAVDSSDDGRGLNEYDTCATNHIASVNYRATDSGGDFTITPLGVGMCQMTVDDGNHCVTSTVVVLPGSGAAFARRR